MSGHLAYDPGEDFYVIGGTSYSPYGWGDAAAIGFDAGLETAKNALGLAGSLISTVSSLITFTEREEVYENDQKLFAAIGMLGLPTEFSAMEPMRSQMEVLNSMISTNPYFTAQMFSGGQKEWWQRDAEAMQMTEADRNFSLMRTHGYAAALSSPEDVKEHPHFQEVITAHTTRVAQNAYSFAREAVKAGASSSYGAAANGIKDALIYAYTANPSKRAAASFNIGSRPPSASELAMAAKLKGKR